MRQLHPRLWAWLAALTITGVILGLNVIPGDGRSNAFEEQSFEEFTISRGWPFGAWTFADDGGDCTN